MGPSRKRRSSSEDSFCSTVRAVNRRCATRVSVPRLSGPRSRCARSVPVTNEPRWRKPQRFRPLHLRGPGAAPSGGFHVLAGEELAGSLRGAVLALIEPAGGAAAAGCGALGLLRIL